MLIVLFAVNVFAKVPQCGTDSNPFRYVGAVMGEVNRVFNTKVLDKKGNILVSSCFQKNVLVSFKWLDSGRYPVLAVELMQADPYKTQFNTLYKDLKRNGEVREEKKNYLKVLINGQIWVIQFDRDVTSLLVMHSALTKYAK